MKLIEGQPAGEIDNPDLPDLWNTVVKMAEKRARVDAVLAVTGASALFTQDMEDAGADGSPSPAEAPAMGATTATGPQKAAVRRYFTQYGLKWSEIKALFARANVPITTDDPGALVDGLLKHQVSALLDLLKDGAVPTGETSDVPSDLTVFDSPAEETGERTEAIFDVGPS